MNNTSLFFIQKKVEFCCEKIGLGFISLTYDERGALLTAPLPFSHRFSFYCRSTLKRLTITNSLNAIVLES